MACSVGGDPWAYTPPLSLWGLVQQSVSPGEQDEIKSMLGTSLVETTLDLHNEVQMLLEIWKDCKEESESENHHLLPLAEPPHVRERLIQEICFLAESVREKSASKGMDPSALLSRHNFHVLDYAQDTKRCGSSLGSARPHSARSSDDRHTPLTSAQHGHSHLALDSAITEEVSSANKKLNYLQFDEVCNRLRETLTKEMEQLETDVAFLHACLTDTLDDPTDGSTLALSREPTLTDLREERSLLEKDLLSTESLPSTPHVHRPHFVPTPSVLGIGSKMAALGPVSTKLKPAHAAPESGSHKSVPLKALHHAAPTLPSSSAPSTSTSANPSTSHTSRTPAPPHPQNTSAQGKPAPGQSVSRSDGRSYPWEKGDRVGKTEGSGLHSRTHSAAHVKVVPVGSVLEPRVDSAGSRSLMPTPPPAEEAVRVPRPNSAQRFRRMVLSQRETT
ncbi:coiled-coil domain-containing protein 24-like [Babylonia areolata]|uniref:coiled-coil domain-containing protein 24-like n=1 Tax=Babylonia areolata TaxID=304850 RepID=UPI003FD5D94A